MASFGEISEMMMKMAGIVVVVEVVRVEDRTNEGSTINPATQLSSQTSHILSKFHFPRKVYARCCGVKKSLTQGKPAVPATGHCHAPSLASSRPIDHPSLSDTEHARSCVTCNVMRILKLPLIPNNEWSQAPSIAQGTPCSPHAAC